VLALDYTARVRVGIFSIIFLFSVPDCDFVIGIASFGKMSFTIVVRTRDVMSVSFHFAKFRFAKSQIAQGLG